MDPSRARQRTVHRRGRAALSRPPAEDPAQGLEQGARVSGRRRLVSLAFGVLVLAGGAWLVARNAADLRDAARDVGVGAVVASAALAVVGTVLIEQVWFALLRGLGVLAPPVEAAGVFFVSQLGKYLPGSVWPIVAQMEFGRRWGTPRRTMLTANILMLAMLTATGLVVGAVLLPWSSGEGLAHYWWLLLLLVPLLVCLHPRTLPAVLDRLLGLVGREPLQIRVSGRAMVQAMLWSLAVWLVMGLHLVVLVRALGATGADPVAAAVGGMALGWAAGLIFIPAPAGAGVREAVLVLTLTPQVGAGPALAVALASRMVLLLADVLLAAVGALTGAGVARSGRERGRQQG
ncbi:lysylphosphatidylglycerol synthase domain-containing protein [Nocardioides mesophilus]|uniref:Flippase-like domain-containing protein n=1 Tax=Nocardioides mesophilus TaxID=433659 RepID=A0A7G9R8C9_9ACTN|nr:lysylphosphatidylglycerol synthase domain-containing protein [Nocardioides mesophilus]QNN51854.1 flippase-like domain-containing protein [Nocardioides mesophilus]